MFVMNGERFGGTPFDRGKWPPRAIHNALPLVTSDPFMVQNGDSMCRVDLAGMLRSHRQNGAALTLAAAPKGERSDAGTLQIASNGQLLAFQEKAGLGDSINAGIYLMTRRSRPAGCPRCAIRRQTESISAGR